MFKRTKNTALSIVALGTMSLLAACQSDKDLAGPPLLNGNWASSDGVYVAQLSNGQFKAVANDTGNIISEGSYIALAEDKVRLNWVGRISGTGINFHCEEAFNAI